MSTFTYRFAFDCTLPGASLPAAGRFIRSMDSRIGLIQAEAIARGMESLRTEEHLLPSVLEELRILGVFPVEEMDRILAERKKRANERELATRPPVADGETLLACIRSVGEAAWKVGDYDKMHELVRMAQVVKSWGK